MNRRVERIWFWLWACVCSLAPGLAMAKGISDRQVVSMIGAVVSVPCAMILIALIIRAYWRLREDIPLTEREKKTFPKKMRWTWILTFVPFLAITSELFNSWTGDAIGLALMILIPTTMLGATSHNLNKKLKARCIDKKLC